MRKVLLPFFGMLLFTTIAFAQLPEDFYDEVAVGGFDFHTGVVFDQNGKGYVWEKKGFFLSQH